jgi:hypothetical protein
MRFDSATTAGKTSPHKPIDRTSRAMPDGGDPPTTEIYQVSKSYRGVFASG